MVVGALEGERSEHGFKGLGVAPGEACRQAAVGALAEGTAVVGQSGVEALLDGARGQLQRGAADSGFDGLEVDLGSRSGAHEALDLGADVGRETLAQRFF